jgi:hypothetical protein
MAKPAREQLFTAPMNVGNEPASPTAGIKSFIIGLNGN